MTGKGSRNERLAGWKKIAGHLDVSVRTAQNWEKKKGLPVKRLVGKKEERSEVVSYVGDIQKWREDRERSDQPALIAEKARTRILAQVALAILLGACLVSVLLWSSLGSLQGRLSQPDLDGERLRIWDNHGNLRVERLFEGLSEEEYSRRAYGGRTFLERSVVFWDVDEDSQLEILFNYLSLEERSGLLVCLDEKGKSRWQHSYGASFVYLGQHYRSENFVNRHVGIQILTRADRSYVLVVSNHIDGFPAQLALLDPLSGDKVFQYWHPGWIADILVQDFDEDGSEEILLAGINNPGLEPGLPALVVLDLPTEFGKNGSRSLKEDRFGFELSEAVSKYVLFPLPDVFSTADVGSYAFSVYLDGDRRLGVRVGREGGRTVLYTLDYQLRVVEVRPDIHVYRSHEEKRLAGILDHSLSEDEVSTWSQLLDFSRRNPNANNPTLMKRFHYRSDRLPTGLPQVSRESAADFRH